jgi:hypothetical protein
VAGAAGAAIARSHQAAEEWRCASGLQADRFCAIATPPHCCLNLESGETSNLGVLLGVALFGHGVGSVLQFHIGFCSFIGSVMIFRFDRLSKFNQGTF